MTVTLVLLGLTIAIGEVFVLRIGPPSPLPLSYAVLPVLAVRFDATPYAVTVVVGSAAGMVLARLDRAECARRLPARVLVAAATFGAFRSVFAAFDHREEATAVLGALVAAAVAALAADEVVRRIARTSSAFAGRGSLAWLALGSSGVLMALGYRGVDGGGDMGWWGVALLAMPLLAAWYSFTRLDTITRVAAQTVDALSLAPERAGIVPRGHAERVATVALRVGDELALTPGELAALGTAARLHHLGAVTLDGDGTVEFRSTDVSAMTGAMLRDTEPLAPARAVIEGRAGIPSAILRVANAFDDLAGDDPRRARAAIDALRSAPVHAYDAVVVDALAVVVERHVVEYV